MVRACSSIVTIAILASSAPAAAGLTATIDRKQAGVGEQILLTLTVDGTQSAAFEPPPLEAFDVYDRGTSTQMSVVNGEVSTSVKQTYLLVPKRAGTFTIGPVLARVAGDSFTSEPIQIRVTAAGAQPQADDDLILQARVSKTRPYLGEFFLYTLRFYTRVRIAGGSIEEPELAEFIKHQAGEKRAYRATLGGVEYQVNEFRWALQAQKEGKIRIAPGTLAAEVVMRSPRRGRRSLFDDFFDSPFGRTQTQSRTLRSNAIDIEVQPLPPAPAGFTGLVGSFDLHANLSQSEVHVGESTTLTLRVSGRGNAAAISEPAISGLDSFKVYDDKPITSIDTDEGGQHGKKTYKKALVPVRQGTLTIPAIVLPYFDPNAGAYRRARAGPFTVNALPPTGDEELKLTEFVTSGAGKVAVRVLADDILPIHRRMDALERHDIAGAQRWLFGTGLVAPALACVGLVGVRRRRARFEAEAHLRRRRSALKRAKRAAARAGDPAALSRAIRDYVGDKLNLEGGALTPAETAEHLRQAGVPEELVGEARSLLEQCEAAQYGGAEVELAGAGNLLSRLDREVQV
jgi:hypothetical protein